MFFSKQNLVGLHAFNGNSCNFKCFHVASISFLTIKMTRIGELIRAQTIYILLQ